MSLLLFLWALVPRSVYMKKTFVVTGFSVFQEVYSFCFKIFDRYKQQKRFKSSILQKQYANVPTTK